MLHTKRRMFSKTMINETKVKKLLQKMCGSVEESKIYLPDIFIDVQKINFIQKRGVRCLCDAFDQVKTKAIIGKEKLLTAAFQIIY